MLFFIKLLMFLVDRIGGWGFALFALIPTIILSIPAWFFEKKSKYFFYLDLGFPFYAMIFWVICLVFFRSRGDSLINLTLEPLLAGSFSLVLLYLKVFVFSRYTDNNALLFLGSIIFLFVMIFCLKLFLPVFPE